MKKLFFSILILTIFIIVTAERIVDFGKSLNNNGIEVITHNDMETNIHLALNQLIIDKGENEYDILKLKNGQLYSEDIGKPQIPYYRRVIAIPDRGDVKITVKNIKTVIVPGKFNIQPTQGPQFEVKDFENEWVKDDEFYSKDAFYPGKTSEIMNIGSIRSFRIATFYFYPLQYNPVTGEAEIITDCDIIISYEGIGKNEMNKTIPVSERWIPIYEQMLWNWKWVKNSKPSTSMIKGGFKDFDDNTFFSEGDYLILVVSDEMTAKIKELAAWKAKLGYTPVIKQIQPSISVAALNDTIKWCYENWASPPEFVLLVGEGEENEVANHIESHLFACTGYSYGIEGDTRNDHYYSLQPSDADWYSDLFISRIPARDSIELGVWIDKVIEYEGNPPTGSWFTSYFCIGDIESGRIFDITARQFGLNLEADGNFDDLDTLLEGNFANGVMGAHVIDSIDEGHNIMVFRGHGDEGSLFGFYGGGDYGYDNMFMRTNVPGMSTESMGMGFMFAPTCLANNFTYPNYESMGELMCNMTGKGITGYFGATNVSLSFYNDSMALGLSHALTGASATREFQVVSVYGKNYMETYAGSGTYFELEHYLMNEVGDPACRIWTKVPDTLLAAHNATFVVGLNDISITVRDENSTLIINAIVTVWDTTGADTVYRRGLTNASGQITFSNIQFLDGDLNEVMISASKENYIPYIGDADVVGGAPSQPSIISLFDCARVPLIRPILNFVSTDLEADDIVYRILIDDNYSFSSPDSFTTGSYLSGDTVEFTFPSDLTDDVTYFWKVKASDPSGSGYWGGYTPQRTFTVFTPLGANNCSWYQNKNNQMQQNTYNAAVLEDDSIILAPSGGITSDTLFFEGFESGVMPAGWSVVNGDGDAYTWYIATTGQGDLGLYEPSNVGSYYAYYSDDDAGGTNTTAEEYLYSPAYPISDRDSLFFSYVYGFRNYATDPDQSLYSYYSIYKTGSWGAWQLISSLVGVDASGSEIVNLTSQLPFDSVKLYWLYEDNTAWGWATAVDNIAIYGKTFVVNNDGYFITPTVHYNDLNNTYTRSDWGNITWKQSSDADSISVQALYHNGVDWILVPDGDLAGNSAGFYGGSAYSFTDISGLNVSTYDSIKAQFNLYRKAVKTSTQPTIIAVEIGNKETSLTFISLTSISAEYINNAVRVSWKPSIETDISNWEIARSEDNESYKTIASIKPNNCNYTYDDKSLINNEYYYKIVSVSSDGSKQYFGPIKVRTGIVPRVFALMPVSPTLIRNDASISYQMPRQENVTIGIHDILGREVNVIVDEMKNAGFYKVKWNGDDKYGRKLSAGTYFIKMKAGDFEHIEKAIIIK